MRVQKCIEVNGHQIPDFGLNLGGRLIWEVALYASIYGTVKPYHAAAQGDLKWLLVQVGLDCPWSAEVCLVVVD